MTDNHRATFTIPQGGQVMSEDYEGFASDPDEALFMFATQLNEGAKYVLGGPFRSTTIQGDIVALFMARSSEALGRVIHYALDQCADPATDMSARLTVCTELNDDSFEMTSLPVTALGDASLN